MKHKHAKVFNILILIIFSFSTFSTLFALQTNYSTKFSMSFNFSEEQLKTNFGSEFRITGNSFGSGYDLSFNLNGTNLESAKLVLKFDTLKLSLYDNTIFGSTNDPIGIYKIDSGKNGIEIEYSPFKFVLFNNFDLMYISTNLSDYYIVIGKRGKIFDTALSYSSKFLNNNLKAEVAVKDIANFDVKNTFLFGQFADGSYNWGLTYEFIGSEEKQNTVNLWYKFGNLPSFNTYLNTQFGTDNLTQDLLNNAKVGIDVNLNQFNLSLKKTNLTTFSGLMPTQWGEFLISFGTKFSLAEFNGSLQYTFGKPIHSSVNTIGEIFYGEIGRNFGNISLFAKYQKIIGYYEEKDFLYSEVKFTGFSFGEVKFWIGNGEFDKNNPFIPILGVEFNLWW